MLPGKTVTTDPTYKQLGGEFQRGLISSTLFNMTVDNLVRNCLALTVEEKLVCHDVLGLAVRQCLGLFYSDNGMVVSRYLEWIQGNLNLIISLFWWYILVANVAKFKSMTCQPVSIRSGMLEEAGGRKFTGRRGGLNRATQTEYPLSGLWCETHSGIDYGAPTVHAWNGAVY